MDSRHRGSALTPGFPDWSHGWVTVRPSSEQRRESVGGRVLSVTGEIDAAVAPQLVHAVERELRTLPTPTLLVIEMSGVTFLGSGGVRALVAILATTKAATCRLHLRRPSASVMRVLTVTGLDRGFSII